jgi:hypothetical protein
MCLHIKSPSGFHFSRVGGALFVEGVRNKRIGKAYTFLLPGQVSVRVVSNCNLRNA